MAKAFGVERRTAWRVLHETHRPSVQFIAGVLSSMPDASFPALFEIELREGDTTNAQQE
jgi:hypothetical protein